MVQYNQEIMVLLNDSTSNQMFSVTLHHRNKLYANSNSVHQSAVVRPGRKPRFSLFLKGGEQVEFDVVEGNLCQIHFILS